MIGVQLVAALLLVAGGTVVVLVSLPRRPDVRARIRTLDGALPPSRRQWRRAVTSGVVITAIPAVPVGMLVAGAPAVLAVAAGVLLLPLMVTIGLEIHAGLRRPGMPPRLPLTPQWQRRLATTLVARLLAPFPAAPLRQRRPRVRRRPPTLTSAGTGRRLLVMPPGRPPLRLWEIAEIYLGSRHRYRNILTLNRGRRSPDGENITEDSRIGAGWTLIMPRDAVGVGLVDLPGDPRVPTFTGATVHTAPGAAPSTAFSEIEDTGTGRERPASEEAGRDGPVDQASAGAGVSGTTAPSAGRPGGAGSAGQSRPGGGRSDVVGRSGAARPGTVGAAEPAASPPASARSTAAVPRTAAGRPAAGEQGAGG
jgi:hypothetical protein